MWYRIGFGVLILVAVVNAAMWILTIRDQEWSLIPTGIFSTGMCGIGLLEFGYRCGFGNSDQRSAQPAEEVITNAI